MTPVIGITGGIACGKSTVARFFAELGIPVVDADVIAREVVAAGSDGLRGVIAEFGPRVLGTDGTLDRTALAAIVFADASARLRINGILHPLIAAASAKRIADLAALGPPYVVYEAALLVENALHRGLAALVVIAASESTQLVRVMKRDGIDEHAARGRIASQLPLAEKLSVADYVIDNDGSIDDTRAETVRVHNALLARFGTRQ